MLKPLSVRFMFVGKVLYFQQETILEFASL